MLKKEMKMLHSKVNCKMKEIKTEIKALQQAIDRGKGDTGRIGDKFKELKLLHKEIFGA
jgi:hypothetical protein